jgi:ketosteroid isomerase-like protein
MSQENVEIVRRIIASFNAGDMVAVAELFHPAAEWRDLSHAPDTPEVLVGVEAIIAAGGQWAQVFDEFSAEVYEYIDAHPWVVCDTRWSGKGRGSTVGVDIRQADAYEVRHGKVASAVLAYTDTESALQAIELRE